MPQQYCVEYIVKTVDGKTRLIILDNLPESQLLHIEALNEHGFDRLSAIERNQAEHGFADEPDYNDGDAWKDHPQGVYIRVVDKAEDLHKEN
jgi:hypothetical protein